MRKAFLTGGLVFLMPLFAFAFDFNETRTEHYRVRTTLSPQYTAQLGLLMEELYTRFSRFTGDPSSDLPVLYVTELSSPEEWSQFLDASLPDGEIYFSLVRQGLSGQGEIVFYNGGRDDSTASLIHLALFQYLEACNSETPFWIKAGLARLFETLPDQSTGQDVPPINWSAFEEWVSLEDNRTYPLNKILTATEEDARLDPVFHSQAWALVTYLIQASGKEGRLLWETVSLIRTGKRGEWITSADPGLEGSLNAFMGNLQKPARDGDILKKLYAAGDRDGLLNYLDNNELSPPWLEYYYRGLIQYERGLFGDGLDDFERAEKEGAPKADVLYSQGLCLWEMGEREEAEKRLGAAESLKKGIIPKDLSRLLDS